MYSHPTDDIHAILKYLPHRFPFLLVDRILDFQKDSHIVALKNVTYNEPFFPGHFPQSPVFPGVLILEAMAQATGIYAVKKRGYLPQDNMVYYFVGIDKARFKQPVVPGDQMIITMRHLRTKRGIWLFEGDTRVNDKVVCSASVMCTEKEVEA
ncbi:MAG TPA: 3-hydroxyacyl-ACP dehydratase FabZ [Thiotrichales bacterium]|nr:3-hydroxyacyl-ACP dehydratase FabZ [Thiotrichales bacterium]